MFLYNLRLFFLFVECKKLFRTNILNHEKTKLSDRKIRFICNHVVNICDWTIESCSNQYRVSKRRIQQLVKTYRDTGEYPKLKKNRRPKVAPLTAEERNQIDLVWQENRFGARMIYNQLRAQKIRIQHHKIHAYLKATGRSKPNPTKQKKRKRCRYERQHSFSLVHGDWHRTTKDHPHTIIWLDDASRFIHSGEEFDSATSEHTIETFQSAIKVASSYCAIIREVNTDQGAQFFSNHPNSMSQFERFLHEAGIKHIPSRRNNPHTNGKLERLWFEYDKHRWRYNDIHEFMQWYNRRMHGSLWMKFGETPGEADLRKCPEESLLGMFWRFVE